MDVHPNKDDIKGETHIHKDDGGEREREQSWNTCKPSPGTHIVSSMDVHTHKDDIKGETHIHKDDGGERERAELEYM